MFFFLLDPVRKEHEVGTNTERISWILPIPAGSSKKQRDHLNIFEQYATWNRTGCVRETSDLSTKNFEPAWCGRFGRLVSWKASCQPHCDAIICHLILKPSHLYPTYLGMTNAKWSANGCLWFLEIGRNRGRSDFSILFLAGSAAANQLKFGAAVQIPYCPEPDPEPRIWRSGISEEFDGLVWWTNHTSLQNPFISGHN